jgi:hypothetical protein
MGNRYPNRFVNLLIHVAAWIGVMCAPYLIGIFYPRLTPPFDLKMLVMPLLLMVLFYADYLWLINKLLFNRRVAVFLTVNVVLIVLFTLLPIWLRPTMHPESRLPHFGDTPPGLGGLPFLMNIAMQLLIVGLSVSIRMTGKWYEARQRMRELERANTEAELQQIKSQLNPHFLFNSLNNIYALIAFDPDKAQLALHDLCDMLRYQLYEANRELIPLQKEVEFVRSYCDLMRLRMAPNVTVNLDLADESGRTMIAPLLFVSIVENAFKHGVSPSEPSYISVSIAADRGRIECTVRNSDFPKRDNDRSGSGIGIENLRRRLELLYPGTHTFRTERMGSEFIAQLTLKTIL